MLCVFSFLVSLVSCSNNPQINTSSANTSSVQSIIDDKETPLGTLKSSKVFHKAKQAGIVYYADISEENDDMKATLRTLQGLVARTSSASIYLIDDDDDSDNFWRRYCSSEYSISFVFTDVDGIISLFKDMIKSIVIYSDEKEKTYQFETAQNIAMINDGIIATESVMKRLEDLEVDAKQTDISNLFASKRAAYEYIITKIAPVASDSYIASTDQSCTFNDYIYAVKALNLNFDSGVSWQKEMHYKLIKSTRYRTLPILFNDNDSSANDIKRFSENGFVEINIKGLSNITFFSSVSSNSQAYSKVKGSDISGKNPSAYFSIGVDISSPGELQHIAHSIINDYRNNTPITIKIHPALLELAPPIMNWYVQNSSAKYSLICDGMGWSRVNLEKMNQDNREAWYTINNYFLDMSAITTTVCDITNDDILSEYISKTNLSTVIIKGSAESVSDTKIIDKATVINGISFSSPSKLTKWMSTHDYDMPSYYFVDLPLSLYGDETGEIIDSIVSFANKISVDKFRFTSVENLSATANANLLKASDISPASDESQTSETVSDK